MSARTAALAIRAWIISPVTMTVAVLVAAVMGVSLWISPPREVAAQPVEITVAKVGGFCATVIAAEDGSVWALAPGAVDGQLKRVDAAGVDRGAAECQR